MTNSTAIIQSLLDTDAYKLHMQQAVFHRYPEVDVVAEFHCRSQEDLRPYQAQIEQQINQLAQLQLQANEYHYLSKLPVMQQDYLDYLLRFRFNPAQVSIDSQGEQLAISIEGKWLDVILWEVPLLAIISEIRGQARYPQIKIEQAVAQLHHKLQEFEVKHSDIDLTDFSLVDFGTRRRFSKAVQHAIVQQLQPWPYFKGSSNYQLAMQHQLTPVGTQAHEWFQAHQQLSGELADSQQLALHAWLQEYPDALGIALTDCINMDAFLRDFNPHLSQAFIGLRHDSGDPIIWGEKAIAHYVQQGIDPKQKLLVFSDGLSLQKAGEIYRHFHGRIQTSFGIGTQLTCDIPTVDSLNIVLKLTHCQGKPVAKISDEPGKSLCRDERYLLKLKQAFHLAS